MRPYSDRVQFEFLREESLRYGTLGLTLNDRNRATPGFTLYSPTYENRTFLLNMAGEIVHDWTHPGEVGNYAYLTEQGNLLVATRTAEGPKMPAKGGLIREVDWHGNVRWEYTDHAQHHDFRMTPNGNLIYVAWSPMTADQVARIRGDHEVPAPGSNVQGDVVREVDRDGNLVWEWVAAEHLQIEAYPLSASSNTGNYAHVNAVMPLADGRILLCFRHIDLLAALDPATGRFTWTYCDRHLGGPHDFQMNAAGNFMVFANRSGQSPRGSAVLEIDPASKVILWKYQGNPTHTFDSHYISGCQRLDSGNTLICEGLWGRIFEVTADADIVWEYINPRFVTQTRGPSIGEVNAVFRAYRYAPNSPQIRGRLGNRMA